MFLNDFSGNGSVRLGLRSKFSFEINYGDGLWRRSDFTRRFILVTRRSSNLSRRFWQGDHAFNARSGKRAFRARAEQARTNDMAENVHHGSSVGETNFPPLRAPAQTF